MNVRVAVQSYECCQEAESGHSEEVDADAVLVGAYECCTQELQDFNNKKGVGDLMKRMLIVMSDGLRECCNLER